MKKIINYFGILLILGVFINFIKLVIEAQLRGW